MLAAEVAARVRARYLVIGRLRQGAERVEVEARLYDAEGQPLLDARAAATGLGAPQVAACEVAQRIGAHVLEVHAKNAKSGDSPH